MCKTCARGGRMRTETFEENGVLLEGNDDFKYLGNVLNNVQQTEKKSS